jgi:hypothetical protein
MLLRPLPLFLISAALAAQVPSGYLVVAERTTGGEPLTFVETKTGVATTLRRPANVKDPTHTWVAVDATVANRLYASVFLAISVVPTMNDFTLLGNEATSRASVQLRGVTAMPVRGLIHNADLICTVAAGTAPGIYIGQKCGCGTFVKMAALPQAHDLVVRNGKVYATTYSAATNSTVVEVDIVSWNVRTLGTNYPGLRSLAFFGNSLLGGNDAGELVLIDLTTGQSSLLLATGKGPILAIAQVAGSPLFHFATKSEVYAFPPATPLYQSQFTIEDIDAGVDAAAALLRFGKACPGSGGRLATFAHTGVPALGNPSFALQIDGATASRPGTMFIGSNRQAWGALKLPFPLDPLGMTGCTLYGDPLLAFPIATDGLGTAKVTFAVPSDPIWRNLHFVAQALVSDPGANPAQVVASDAAEGIIR